METLYARREPTTDSELQKDPNTARERQDVVIYRDPKGSQKVTRYSWTWAPEKRRETVTINGVTYRLEWLPDAPPPIHEERRLCRGKALAQYWERRGQPEPFKVQIIAEIDGKRHYILDRPVKTEAEARRLLNAAEALLAEARLLGKTRRAAE